MKPTVSLRRPWPVDVEFVMALALGQFVLWVLRFSCQYHSTSAPYLLIYLSCMLCTVAIGSIVKNSYLTETDGKVDIYCLKQVDAILPVLFTFALEYINKVQGKKGGLKLSGMHQLVICVADINLGKDKCSKHSKTIQSHRH